MTDPHAIVTPDDSGSDTLARFQYQAHVTFPYCLKLATGDGVTDVYAEHIEDIAVRESDAWRFLQVKSRKPSAGNGRSARLLSRARLRVSGAHIKPRGDL